MLTKLEQRMSEKERAEHAAYGEQLVYMPDHGTKSYEGKEDIIDAIQSANRERQPRSLSLRRCPRTRPRWISRAVPLAMYRHGLYAIGARLKAATDAVETAPLGVFAIERFDEVEYLRGHDSRFRRTPSCATC